MKIDNIQTGHIYHDGKQGLREVVGVDKADGTVRYRLLAAKVEREFLPGGQSRTVIGRESVVTLAAFAAWAKAEYTADEGNRFLLCLQAGKVKLSPAEHGYIVGLLADDPQGRPHRVGKLSVRAFQRPGSGRGNRKGKRARACGVRSSAA